MVPVRFQEGYLDVWCEQLGQHWGFLRGGGEVLEGTRMENNLGLNNGCLGVVLRSKIGLEGSLGLRRFLRGVLRVKLGVPYRKKQGKFG
jgi:hypothetical protein